MSIFSFTKKKIFNIALNKMYKLLYIHQYYKLLLSSLEVKNHSMIIRRKKMRYSKEKQ